MITSAQCNVSIYNIRIYYFEPIKDVLSFDMNGLGNEIIEAWEEAKESKPKRCDTVGDRRKTRFESFMNYYYILKNFIP